MALYNEDGQFIGTLKPAEETTGIVPAPLTAINRNINQAGVGALKGAGSTLFGAGKLLQSAYNVLPTRDISLLGEKPEFLKPKGTAESIGFGIEQIGEFLLPIGAGAKAAKTAAKILPKIVPRIEAGSLIARMARGIAESVGVGAEFGAKTLIQTGGDIKQATRSAIFGAAAVPALKAVSAIGNWATRNLPERLYSQIFKTAEDDLRFYYQSLAKGKAPNPTLAKEILDRGVFGSSKNMAIYSFKKLDILEKELQTTIVRAPAIVITKRVAYNNLLKTIETTFKNGFYNQRANEARRLVSVLRTNPKSVPAIEILRLRRFLDKMRNTSSFRLDPRLTPRQGEYKEAADLLRSLLKKHPQSSALLNEERIFTRGLDAIIEDAAKRQNKNLLNLTDAIIGGGGLATGLPGQGIGAMAAFRGFQQPPTLTGLGLGLSKLGTAAQKITPALKQVPRLIAPTVFNNRQ